MAEQQEAKPTLQGSVTIQHRGTVRTVPADQWQATIDELVGKLGPWEHERSSVKFNPPPTALKPLSTFTKQHHDADAEQRIKAQHETLAQHGVNVDTSRQLFATGTRMAASGYATQADRKAEHENMRPLADVAHYLTQRVVDEKRFNRVMKSGELAKSLAINGKLTVDGYAMHEQAIRGLLLRLESPAASYVFGVRERLREDSKASPAMRDLDKRAIVETLVRECERRPDVDCNLRLREGLGDCFAVVSPGYGEADAPSVVPTVLDALKSFGNVKATSSYDPKSTSWEIRAQVHTPTPTEQQAVGEPFQGYVSIRSRDNGTGRLSGGGGILIIACLNASVYTAGDERVSRVHRGRVLIRLDKLVASAARNVSALCEAWGIARTDVLDVHQADEKGKLLPIAEVLTGFYRFALTERRGELVGVLPGRTATHASALARVYQDERRNPSDVTRADLAQGFTRYIQTQPLPVQQEAEAAVAAWLVKASPVRYLPA